VPVERAIEVARAEVGFELLDVQLLRPHYALTLRAWVARLERAWDAAVEAAGEEVARTWRLYMAGARRGFERGELDVAQLLLARPLADGTPAARPLRPWVWGRRRRSCCGAPTGHRRTHPRSGTAAGMRRDPTTRPH